MLELQKYAEEQKALGMHYIRVTSLPVGGSFFTGSHAENIDIDQLLAIDLGKMDIDKPYLMGDRNWMYTGEVAQFAYSAIRKIKNSDDGSVSYQFGEIYDGEGEGTWNANARFYIYATDIKPYPRLVSEG